MRYSNESGAGYQNQLRLYKTKNIYRTILLIIVLLAIALIIRLRYSGHVYSSYEITESIQRQKTDSARDLRLGSSIFTYSKDGAHCTDSKGNVVWNQTYEIQDIKVVTNDSIVAIAHYNGRNIYVLDEKEQLSTITTTLPIRNIAVAANGVLTAVLSDGTTTWLNTYRSDGEPLFSGQTHMSNSGYPIAVALSQDGEMLEVSYIYVDTGTVKTTVAFYNFGDVGDNYKDYLVSGFDYTDLLVPEVGFLSNSVSYAVGDGRLMFYKGAEQPSIQAEYLYDQEIQSVFHGNGYLGLILASDKADSRYRMDVYNSDGKLEENIYFDMNYMDVVFEKNDLIIYNESECRIFTYDGREKYAGEFAKTVNVLIPMNGAYKYMLVNDECLDSIQLN